MLQTATEEHNKNKLQIIKKNHWRKQKNVLGTGAFIHIHRNDQGIIAKKTQEQYFNFSQKTTWRQKKPIKGTMRWAQKALIQTHCKYVFSSVKDEKGPDRLYLITPFFVYVFIYAYLFTHI